MGGGVIDDRKVEMGVDIGISVAGKMFGDSHHVLTLHSKSIHDTQPCDTLGVGAERAGADDGILGIGVDVDDGSEIDMNSHHTALATNLLTHTPYDAVGRGRQFAEAGISGETEHILEAHAESPFAVDTNKKRNTGGGLEVACELGLAVGSAGKEANTSDAKGVHVTDELFGLATIEVERYTNNHELRNALPQGESRIDGVDPIYLGVIESEVVVDEFRSVLERANLLGLGSREMNIEYANDSQQKKAFVVFHCLRIWSI